MIAEAIQHYHELLANGYMAEDTHYKLYADLEKRGLFFGDVPVCRVLRPHFYTYDDWVYLTRKTELILKAFRKAHEACMENADYRAQLDLDPYEEELFSLDKGFTVPWSSSRLDAFFKPEDQYLRFVEYNAETPAGLGYGDELASSFLNLDVMKTFKKAYHVGYTGGQPQLLEALLRTYKDWGGTEHPNIAIVDWQDVPTLREHEITRAYFEAQGHKCILADPNDLEYHHDYLWKGDFPIHIIYKRVLYSELIDRMTMASPIVQAIKDRAVFITNSPSAKLMSKKASLALLSDEANRDLFSPEELSAIRLHIPWTRRLEERKTFYEGQEIDLIPYVVDNRENFVLKPNDEYGGAGVIIGHQHSQLDWEQAINDALGSPYVIQEKITLVEREFPALIEDELHIGNRYVDADPYVFSGETVGGCLTRLSSAELLNVTAGQGSVVPMMVIEPV